MARVRTISVNLTAGTAQFFRDLDQANGKLRQFGHEGVTNVQATSGALRVLEGNITNNLRAAERFVANIKGMGPLLQAAFPVVGAVALAGVVGELGEKVYKFYADIRDAGAKADIAFRQLVSPLRLTNDELAVSNDRLQNEIAKLEGRHENTLKLMLDEARVAADKLAESLDKDLANLNKVLDEEKVSIARRLLGTAGTGDLGDEIKRFREQIASETLRGNVAVHEAKTPEDAAAAQQRLARYLDESYKDEIAKMEAMLSGLGKIATPEHVRLPFGMGGFYVTDPSEARAKQLGDIIAALRIQRSDAIGETQAAQMQSQREKLQATRDNAAQDRPFEDWMKKTGAEIDAIKARLEAIGKPEAAQLIAKAFGESRKAIEEVNKALERHNTQLTDAQKNQIRTAEQTMANTEAEVKWKDTFTADISAINNRIKAQDLLTAAIGRGYEATKQANVEAHLMETLKEHYGDQQWLQDPEHAQQVASLRSAFGREQDAVYATQVTERLKKLEDQIALERALAAVQADGAEALRQATFAQKTNQIARNESADAAKKLIAAETELFNAEKQDRVQGDVARLQEKIAATERLTAAILQGAAVVRQATVENKLAEVSREGDTLLPGLLGIGAKELATIQQESADHQKQMADIAAGTRLQTLDKEIADLREAAALSKDRLGIEIQLRDLENERIQALVQESLGLRGARDGVRAFFLEMQEDAKSAGQIVYDSLNSALDRVSENMAKMMTGHKTDWAKSFQQLGEQMTQESIKSLLHQGLGALGKLFGVDAGGALKPDGTREKPLWVRIEDGKLATGPNTIDILFSGGAGGSGSGGGAISGVPPGVFQGSSGGPGFSLLDQQSQLLGKLASMGILKLIRPGGAPLVDPGAPNVTSDDLSSLGVFGGAMASGGDVDPGKVYWTGEQGPEPFIPNTAGRILPHSALGGEVHLHYNIDARGADLGAYNRIMQGIEESHNSAVAKGVQAMHEHSQRTPQR